MSGIVVRVDISGDQRILQKLNRISSVDFKPAFMAIGEAHLATIQSRFDRETDPYGKRWEPRKSIPKGKGRKSDPRRKILFLTGRLRNSLIYRATSLDVTIGTNVVYAATHQFGRNSIPARPYIDITEEDAVKYLNILVEYIDFLLDD